MATANLILLLVVSLLVIISVAESKRLTVGFAGKKTTSANDVECDSGVGASEGDTCTTVAENSGLSLDDFLAINPNINCDSFFVGQWLCVNGGEVGQTSASDLTCNEFYGAEEGDTCDVVASRAGLSLDAFLAINPNINCDSFFVGEWLCVNGE